MSYLIKRKQFTPAPEGLHNAVCVDVVDLGLVETKFGKKEQVRLVWELDPESAGTLSDERRFIIQKTYTPSLHEKAALHKDLKSWRGRAFTAEELAGFDLENVIGAPCKILVQHSEDGVYANIGAITKADRGQALKPSGEYVRVKDRPEKESNGHHDSGDFHAPPGEDADIIPF